MPILAREPDIFPLDLLERDNLGAEEDMGWWVIYTRSQREKDLMRRLEAMQVPFYSPVTAKRFRSPSGRTRTSFLPVFPNYVFLYGDAEHRYQAMTTNCVCSITNVVEGLRLTEDLRRIHRLIEQDVPLTLESRLAPGARVRIRSGPLTGMEGTILERKGQVRLLIAVNFIQQGASVLLEDYDVERLV